MDRRAFTETSDLFAYVFLFAPEFTIDDDVTLHSAFGELLDRIAGLERQAGFPDSVATLGWCRKKVALSMEQFEAGNDEVGFAELQEAHHRFLEIKV